MRNLARWFAALFVIAVVCNFTWEMAQSYLYEPMGDWWQSTRRCLLASVGDGVMVVSVAEVIRRFWRRCPVVLTPSAAGEYIAAAALALAMAVVVEWWGLGVGRWAYRAEMPLVPGTRLGVVPLAQMALLTPLTMWLAQRTRGVRK